MEIDRENISNLSDEQLFKTLKKCGLNVGPINKSTRSVYEKRLRNYLDGNSTLNADVTISTVPKEPVAVLTAASLNETFPQARPEQKRDQSPAPVPVVNKKPDPKPTIDDFITRTNNTVYPTRVVEPITRTLQAETNGYSQSPNSNTSNVSSLSRMSYEPIAKSVERKSNELDFKLIKPVTTTVSTNVPSTSVSSVRRDINYGLLDDRQTQPITLSSTYKLPETTTPNIRSRVTTTTKAKIETESAKPVITSTASSKTTPNKEGKSSFKWTYYLLIFILFIVIYIGMNSLNSNPENPVEFIN